MDTHSESPEGAENAAVPGERSGTRHPRRIRWPLAAAVALAALLGVGLWWVLRPQEKIEYVTAAASRGRVAPYVTASGSVNPVTTIQVGTYVSGVIQKLYCDFNTRVKAGQLCAKIDPRPYQVVVDQDRAALAAAKAQLVKDQASLAYAKLNSERQTLLVSQNSTSQDAADVAKSAYQQALAQVGVDQAAIQKSQADLQAAEVNLSYTDITSPVDGTVVSRNVTQGQTVAASFQTPTLFLIATDLTKMQVDTSVSESDIGDVRDGDAASFSVEAYPNHTFQGRVTQVRQSPQTIQNVVTYDVVVAVDNSALLLKPGMTADVRIVTAQAQDALRVPLEALRYWPQQTPKPAQSARQAQVWVLRDGSPLRTPVSVGLTDDAYAQITRGALKAGERVIVGQRTTGGQGTGGRAGARPATSRPRAPFL